MPLRQPRMEAFHFCLLSTEIKIFHGVASISGQQIHSISPENI